MTRAAPVALTILTFMSGPARAETGMGLMVDTKAEQLRRVDLKNGNIIYTSSGIGSGVVAARFAPDGNAYVFIRKNNEAVIRDLSDNEQNRFPVWNAGRASWTESGIWVAGTGKAVLYDPASGEKLGEVKAASGSASSTHFATIAHSETAAGVVTGPPYHAKAVLMDQGNAVVDLGPGCGTAPSPSGTRFSHNLWEDTKRHQTMKVQTRNGTVKHYWYLFDIIPYPAGETEGWSWNLQSWSSNSEDVVLIPTGRGYPQMTDSMMPWIYNKATNKAHCLHSNPYAWNVFWQIHDYFQGKTSGQVAQVNIDWLTATPTAVHSGGSSELSWQVSNSIAVTLDDQSMPPAGSMVVTPTTTTTYTLEALGNGGPKTKTVTVTVTENIPPTVDAGETVSATAGLPVSLNAVVTDDGVPGTGLSFSWTQVSGPNDAVIASPDSEDTSVTCPIAGTYVLRLTASDGEAETSDDVSIVAEDQPDKSILIASPASGDLLTVGASTVITFSATNIDDVVIYLSLDDGLTWDVLAPSLTRGDPDWGAYSWDVPDAPSERCWLAMETYLGREARTLAGPFAIVDGEESSDDPSPTGIVDPAAEPDELVAGCATTTATNAGAVAAGFVLLMATRRRKR